MTKMLGLICTIFYSAAQATSLGVVGEVFPVAEMSFLAFIESRLQDADVISKVKDFEENSSKAVKKYITSPPSLNIPAASKPRIFTYVPQLTLKYNISDTKGQILLKRGTSVNALAEIPTYQPFWIFFDGSILAQRQWAKKALKKQIHPKIILTGGSLEAISSLLQQEIFFDQGGRITRQLRITHVPAIVTREGNALLIQEVAIRENGDAR